MSKDLKASIAVTRFGLGARPGEIEEARTDPEGFLTSQIRPQGADQPQADPESSASRIAEFRDYRQDRRAMRRQAAAGPEADNPRDPVKMAQRMLREETGVDFLARVQLAARTGSSFRERWALFWCNHFTVSATKLVTATVVGPFEQEAIRPNVFGRFEDLLIASSMHPAMLLYLDQAQSVGPHTLAARFLSQGGKQAGLNENLAREIMELHTVGVDAGYTQQDVTQFAIAMTGWSIGGLREDQAVRGKYLFRGAAHESGSVTIMGKTYPNRGVIQARDVMHDLASSPHTARHIALKLGRHFVTDDPPPALTARLEQSFLKTGGRLDELARTLIASPEAWAPEARKFKTPYEFLVSSWRATGVTPPNIAAFAPVMNAMGQKPFSAPSPKGWPEEAATWCAPDAVIKRMSWAEAYAAAVIGERNPAEIAKAALGVRLTPLAAQAIARAETRAEGLSILLMSPEFQRR
ncbi:MAG TPA: DUF1800 family protein [Caulobacteraceae bacterium]|jgi:uncharacterized protein (DUF1800 family)|nr:DUF1800 family protein [Caulobacteraceae bacterium]